MEQQPDVSSTTSVSVESTAASPAPAQRSASPSPPPPEQSRSKQDEPEAYAASKPTLYRGTDEVIRMPQPQQPVRFYGDAVTLNFEQAPLTDVVHAILGDILDQDYVVEHPISGQVTLRTRTPVPRDQLLDILESLLKANNALLIRDRDGRFYVSASPQMSKLKPSVAASASGVAGFSTIIVPLQHISAKNMAEILLPVAEESAFVRIDSVRNLLMLAGTRSQLEGWQEIITTFDVDLLKGMSVGIFPIENASLDDIDAALSGMLGKDGGGEELAAGAGIGSMVRIIPVHRLSSLMVVTPRAHYLERIKVWIERLDRIPDSNFERRLYVYPVQNTHATHLAELLSTILGAAGGSTGSSSKSGGVAPGFTPETVTSGSGNNKKNKKKKNNTVQTGGSEFSLGNAKVVADEENNALLIYATGKEYRKIESALERLDIPPTQVIIEASIIEVTLSDDLQYGLEWSFNGGLGGDYEGVGQLVEGTGIAPKVPGFSYSVLNGTGSIKAVLNALATENLLNVISSPSVMVLDNQTASIHVGDQVPVQSSSTITDGGNERISVEYKDTGVQLQVTPSVNAGGMVTMDIDQTVTDVGNLEPVGGTLQRSFLERNITSRVAVRSSESVVLGGLIRENKSSASTGIPVLHKLPVVGALFGTKTTDDTRTELLVVITPRVISSEADLRDVSREMRRQMRGLDLIDISQSSSFLSGNPSTEPSSTADEDIQ